MVIVKIIEARRRNRLVDALPISSHSRGSDPSQVDLDPRPTPVRQELISRHPDALREGDRLSGTRRVPGTGTLSETTCPEGKLRIGT